MATAGIDPTEGTSSGRRAVTRGVVLTLTGATAVTGGGLLSLGTALTASAQTEGESIDAAAVVLTEQDADVDNVGLALANSGLNTAMGNASQNGAGIGQYPDDGPVYEVLSESSGGGVVSLAAEASNESDGSATVSTGAATATGNAGSTTISQTKGAAAPSGVTVVEQDADVDNTGVAVANSGLNLAIGNASSNNAGIDQVAGGGGLTSATGTATNTSGGTASITTGAATATGNTTSVSITQN